MFKDILPFSESKGSSRFVSGLKGLFTSLVTTSLVVSPMAPVSAQSIVGTKDAARTSAFSSSVTQYDGTNPDHAYVGFNLVYGADRGNGLYDPIDVQGKVADTVSVSFANAPKELEGRFDDLDTDNVPAPSSVTNPESNFASIKVTDLDTGEVLCDTETDVVHQGITTNSDQTGFIVVGDVNNEDETGVGKIWGPNGAFCPDIDVEGKHVQVDITTGANYENYNSQTGTGARGDSTDGVEFAFPIKNQGANKDIKCDGVLQVPTSEIEIQEPTLVITGTNEASVADVTNITADNGTEYPLPQGGVRGALWSLGCVNNSTDANGNPVSVLGPITATVDLKYPGFELVDPDVNPNGLHVEFEQTLTSLTGTIVVDKLDANGKIVVSGGINIPANTDKGEKGFDFSIGMPVDGDKNPSDNTASFSAVQPGVGESLYLPLVTK